MWKSGKKTEFWNNILRAVEAEPRPVNSIPGISGFSHPAFAVGVDEKRRRVVLISGEAIARTAALAANDIQLSLPNAKLVMARPVAVNLGQAARRLSEIFGRTQLGLAEIQLWSQDGGLKEQVQNLITNLTKPAFLAGLRFDGVMQDLKQQSSVNEVDRAEEGLIDLKRMMEIDPIASDRSMGVCSIPLYDLSEEEWPGAQLSCVMGRRLLPLHPSLCRGLLHRHTAVCATRARWGDCLRGFNWNFAAGDAVSVVGGSAGAPGRSLTL